ncbi:MAG TPA: prenyltransferase/squalene oxidase repeat-containing protein, partial [Pirellulales bacterium]
MLNDSRPRSAAAADSAAGHSTGAPHELAIPRHASSFAGEGTIRQAIFRTQQWLLSQQQPDGFWVGELEGDTILESEFLLLLAYLGEEHTGLAKKCANYLLLKQTAAGGWTQYPGGAVDQSATVKAYFALKLVGHSPSAEYMQRARAVILANGGADTVNSFTRFYLALLGQIPYEACPIVPPEFLLLPDWFPVNLYSISAWSRTILVPLSIMSAFQPVRNIEAERGIRELFLSEPTEWPYPRCPGLPRSRGLFSWDRFFHGTDKLFKFMQRHKLTPLRHWAIAEAQRWMLERFTGSDGLGAIFPPMIWSIVALKSLGFADDSSEMTYCRERLLGLVIEEADDARLQPCKSPVWDTALTLRALAASGVDGDHPSIARGVQWLLSQEIRTRGDWSHDVQVPPGGWCF